jgi:hypothetical protein
MSQNQEEEGLFSESHHNMLDDLTIWKEVAPKGKKGKLYGLGSIGTKASKYTIDCSCLYLALSWEFLLVGVMFPNLFTLFVWLFTF